MKTTFARAVSILGHPMLLIPASIFLAISGRVSPAEASTILAVVAGAIVIVGIYLVHGVRSGRFSHIDVTKREERGGFYRITMLSLAIALVVLHFTHAPRGAIVGNAVALVLVVVSSVVNRWIKASLHVAFAIVAAGIVAAGTRNVAITVSFAVVSILVGWSRLVLGRHTPPEVAVGTVLGLVAAGALFVVG